MVSLGYAALSSLEWYIINGEKGGIEEFFIDISALILFSESFKLNFRKLKGRKVSSEEL